MLKEYFLTRENQVLTCKSNLDPNFKLSINFLNPRLQWRLNTINKKQAFAKSLGLHKQFKNPYVIDATAGLGRDALSMIKLGCVVKMLEHSALVSKLLDNALYLAQQNTKNYFINFKNLSLTHIDSCSYLRSLKDTEKPDIIYLDPMFPERTKSAKVKKDMVMLQKIASSGCSHTLFTLAQEKAKHRIIVKRPSNAPHLIGQKPDIIYKGKSIRYDVYCK